jgi:translation elongation factor EF-Ts
MSGTMITTACDIEKKKENFADEVMAKVKG